MVTDDARALRAALLQKRQALARSRLGDDDPSRRIAQITPRANDATVPLSFAQERIWFLDRLDPDSSAYNTPMALRLRGHLHFTALQRSIATIVQRHEILRTSFPSSAGGVVQSIREAIDVSIPVVNLSELAGSEKELEIQCRLLDEARKPFDLTVGPVFRVILLQASTDEHILLFTLHHIVTDGWSRRVLFRELAALYGAFSQGNLDPLPPLPIQFADYALWQRNWLVGETLDRQLGYWRTQLTGAQSLLELPADRPRPAIHSDRGARLRSSLSAELSNSLNDLSRGCNSTLFMTLLAAFGLLLYRHSGQEDIVVGTPIANRMQMQTEGLIGFFLNTLALRLDLSDNPSFKELLGRVQKTALGGYAHQDLPFDKLVEELQPERNMSHSPIFQVMFTLQPPESSSLELEGLEVESILVERSATKMDLLLSVAPTQAGLITTIEYSTDLFDSDRIERMLDSYRVLLEDIVADPLQQLSQLRILTVTEQQKILVEWNDTTVQYGRDSCLHELFEEQVRQTPDAVAVEYGGLQLSYAELNHRSCQVAQALRQKGVGLESRVGICAERSLEMMAGVLGILKAGAAYVPVDPTYPADRIAFIFRDADVRLVLTHGNVQEPLAGSDVERIPLEELHVVTQEPPLAKVPSDCAAYVLYTSGSTGRPKGVILSHTALVNLIQWQRGTVANPGRTLQFASIGFDASFHEMFMAWCSGGTLVLVSEETRRDPCALLNYVRQHRIDTMNLSVAVLQQLAMSLPEGAALPSALRVVFATAEQLQITNEIRAFFGRRNAPELYNHYGPTEAHVVTMYHLPGQAQGNDPHTWPFLPSIGQPIANARIYVLNSTFSPVPVGVPGELYIGGICLARGYLNRPDLTSEKFVPDPFSEEPGSRMYRAGDLARYLPDGKLEYLGRIDNQVKIRGFRIELGEIENALGQHPEVREVVVLAREDTPGDRRLAAYIASSSGREIGVRELREHLQSRLPEYMVPSAYVFLDALPLNSNGKVDRKALPAPEAYGGTCETYTPPSTPIEEGLCEIWSVVLKRDRVGIHDNFFELGGHSLVATQVISRIRNVFQIDLPLRAIFESPTIAGLAERVVSALVVEATPSLPITSVSRSSPQPLSFAQQRIWFIQQLEPDSPAYNMPNGIRLTGPLNPSALERSLIEIVRRHESLRTTVVTAGGVATQAINEHVPCLLEVLDISSLEEDARDSEANRLMEAEAQRPFDLEHGPMFRFSLLHLGSEDHILQITIHHIVCDGWSQGILLRELQSLYYSFLTGEPSALRELPIQYVDYAVWQRNLLHGETLDHQIGYWKEKLDGVPTLLELPTDRPRPPAQSHLCSRRRWTLAPELVKELKAFSGRESTTLFMTMLAGFQTLLYRYSGQDNIVVGTPIANRTKVELEGLIGLFLNTLALRGDCSGDPSFRELLGRVRETALGAYAHQDLPLEKLIDALHLERSLSHSPLFQVTFALQNGPGADLELEGLKASEFTVPGMRGKFDLQLTAMEINGEVMLSALFNTDIFDENRIERMLIHYQTLLESMVANPDERISRLPLLMQPERNQLLVDWNATTADYRRDLCLHQLFEEQVQRTPDSTALVFEGEQLSYSQLNSRANQLARLLQQGGVGPNSLAAVCMERSIDMVVALLAILKAGGAYVAVDPVYPADRIRYTLQDAAASVMLTHEALLDQLPITDAVTVCLDRDAAQISLQRTDDLPCSTHPSDLAYVLYTSGSTGRPKGVAIEHRSPVATVSWALGQLTEQELSGVVFATSICFDLSVYELFVTLCGGGRVLLVENALAIASLGDQLRPSLINTVPSAMAELLRQGAVPSTVVRVNLAGEPLTGALVDTIYDQTGVLKVYDLYGPSEDTTYSTYALRERNGPVTIGRPISNTQAYVLDRNLSPVPVGVPGELYLGGDGLARGYLNRSDLTAERFIPDPFSAQPGGRLYKTGDLVRYRSDANLEYLGRLDHQVKIRGFRIELGEIESALLSHASVREAVVLAREDVPGDKRLAAYIGGLDSTLNQSQLREYLLDKLPAYMVPSAFVLLDSLPLTPNGKVDRMALPAPDGARPELESEYESPQTLAEITLAGIWADVLRIERVGIHDNFFELGGDSILSIQIIARANAAGLKLSPRQIFQQQTIAELARVAGTGAAMHAQQTELTGYVPLTPIQHWFFETYADQVHHYNQARLLTLREPIDPDTVEVVLKSLTLHHDALRLRFKQMDSGWQQSYTPPDNSAVLERFDLTSIHPNQQGDAVTRECSRMQAGLNLQEGPLLRAAYFNMGDQQAARLFMVVHHLAVDGVSWRILLADLTQGLQQVMNGEFLAPAPKTTSLQYWATRLEEYANSEPLRQQLDYWLSDERRWVRPLPMDHVGGANTRSSAQTVRVGLSEAQSRALLQDVPSVYHTQINDFLLTALAETLWSWTGDRKVLVDLEGHGREPLFEEVDLSRTMGWFTSLFPVLLDLAENVDPGARLKAIKEQQRAIPERGLGYGLLRYMCREAEVRDTLREMPQAQVSFNYHGHLDQVIEDSGLFGVAPEQRGDASSPIGGRSHTLDVLSSISGGCLRVGWNFSANQYERATIERLASSYIDHLAQLIDHCQSAEAGGFTPSDFPDASLSQQDLDRLPASTSDVYSLSPMQAGLLFHTLYSSEAGVYLDQIACALEGDLDCRVFENTWELLVERHSVLRTSFHWEGLEEPLQVVHAAARIPIEYRDWRDLSESEQRVKQQDLLAEDRLRGIDLTQAPLMRLTVSRTGDQSWILLWSLHSLIVDRWSLAQLFSEFKATYEAIYRETSVQLPRVRPYRDYIRWLRQQDPIRAEAFWRRSLSGFTAPTALDVDRSPGRVVEGRLPAFQRNELAEETILALQSLARRHHLTLNTFIQGAWALLLSHYSGSEDVLFGATVAGRPPALDGVETILGVFINTLPMRVRAPHGKLLLTWLQELQHDFMELRDYEYSSLVHIQSWSEAPRGVPLFDSTVTVQNIAISKDAIEPSSALRIRLAGGEAWRGGALSLTATPGEGALRLTISYDTERYQHDDITRMVGHLSDLLEKMAANLDQPLSSLPKLTEAEQHKLIVDWNDTAVDYPRHRCVHELFEEQAERTPDALAVANANEILTYSQLNARANQLARYLIQFGVGPDVLVGLCMDRSVEMVVGLLGVLKSGAAYVPLDPGYPLERIAFMLEDSQVSVLLSRAACMDSLPSSSVHVMCVDTDWRQVEGESESNPQIDVTSDNLAYVIYTSGTTGKPKGAMICHGGLTNYLSWATSAYDVGSGQGSPLHSSLSFDLTVTSLFPALLCGGHVDLIAEAGGVEALGYALSDHPDFSLVKITPAHLELLSMTLPAENASGATRSFIIGGEALFGEQLSFWREHAPKTRLINEYGPTETVVGCCAYECGLDSELGSGGVPIGRPIANTRLYVLDCNLRPVPVGVSGELYIGGDGLGRGYLNRADLTADRFVPDPFSAQPGGRLYKTGDLVRYRSDANLEYLGRLDHQVKIRGFRIELGEIESALLSHASVREAVVLAREDVPGDKRLVAYIGGLDTGLNHSQLREYLLDKLPAYMVPAAFVILDSLPLTPNGKVDRKALPAPEANVLQEDAYVAPRNSIEEGLAEIWSAVLHIERVGINDNFFELGGHSLLATQVISRIRSSFQIELPLHALFDAPTVDELAIEVESFCAVRQQQEDETLARLLAEIEELSVDEAVAHLNTSGSPVNG